MSKIIRNTSNSPYSIGDTGVTIAALTSYTIPPQDYLLWAASSNVIVGLSNGTLVVNDGSNNLSLSNGVDLIKGIFPKTVVTNQGSPASEDSAWLTAIVGNTSKTLIGNLNNQLLVHDGNAGTLLSSIAGALGAVNLGVFKQNEFAITTRSEIDAPNLSYIVPAGKKFILNSFVGSYDAQATIHLRLKKQTNGVGSFVTVFRITLQVGGQGQSTIPINVGNGIYIGNPGDVIKVTVESSLVKGTIWCGYTGVEI